jgi:hypothetical protein
MAAALLPNLAAAQSETDARWYALGSLPGGTQVRVDLVKPERLNGTVAGTEGDRLTLRNRDGASVVLARESVARVSRKSRRRAAVYGLIIGFTAGFITGAAAGPYITDFGNPGAARRVKYGIGFGAFSGGIGAGIGALAGTRVRLYP